MEMNIRIRGTSEELAALYKIISDNTPTKKEQIINKYNDYLKSLKLDPTKFQYDSERNTGYFGIINSDDFICGESLSEMVRFTKGELLQYDTQWAVFYYHGDIAITPLKPIRYNVSWYDIDELGLVDGSFNRLNIKDNHYSIGLHTGDIETINTWDELLSRLHIDSKITPTWDSMTDIDLNVNWDVCEHGTATWCRETSSGVPTIHTFRGHYRLALSGKSTSSYVVTGLAWRPLLILN